MPSLELRGRQPALDEIKSDNGRCRGTAMQGLKGEASVRDSCVHYAFCAGL